MTTAVPELIAIREAVDRGERPTATVRALLSWFGAKRRGVGVLDRIDTALRELGLITEPYFAVAWFDNEVEFLNEEPRPQPQDRTVSDDDAFSLTTSGTIAPAGGLATALTSLLPDPTYRIGRLDAANRTPLGVPPDCLLREAITLMLAKDFSQLLVWQSERSVKGMVSWASIGARLALDQPAAKVRDCMEPAYEVSADDSLFSVLPVIIQHQYVLVRGPDNRITGIVTTSDLSLQFQQLAEPFLLLGEIENHIRRLLAGKFSPAELAAVKDPSDPESVVAVVADLTFGGYVRLLEQPDYWGRINLGVDRTVFVRELDRIREIRNEVMHFDPDPLTDDDLRALRRFVGFLQKLRDIGVS